MDNANYVTLTRQAGLMKELQIVANNIANMATTGYRTEGVVFAEMIERSPSDGGTIAMTDARVRYTDGIQGALKSTGGTFDFALQGKGYFQVETEDGPRLTRNGAFTRNLQNELTTFDGQRVLDSAGTPIFLPPDANSFLVSEDGTISADQRPIAQLGVYNVEDEAELLRSDGVLFKTDGAIVPVEGTAVIHGYIENSNVNPVEQISRMIEVQRSYEMGQKFLEKEDERIRGVIRTLGTK